MNRALMGWLCGVVLLVGCSKGPDKSKSHRPKTVIAQGIITHKGMPLADALIVFVPEGDGIAASAYSSDNGGFSMMAFSPEKGAVPGAYTVTVSKMEQIEESPANESSHDAPIVKSGKPKSLIPIKYSQTKTSNLTAQIPPEGSEALKIELKE